MVRRDRTSGIVEIAHTKNSVLSTDRWFVVRKILDKAKQVGIGYEGGVVD
jgi:hypothetical protein